MSSKPHILVVLTSHQPGWYLPELAHPFEILAPHCSITIASHLGGEAPIDQSSISAFKDDEISSKFLKEQQSLWMHTVKLEELVDKAEQFDAIFYVGGYGPMFDLVSSPASTTLLLQFHASHKLISGICHGPATFSRLVLPGTNTYLLAGHKVTGISNTEIEMLKEASGVEEPFSVEDELRKATGGGYVKAEKPFEGKVVVSKVDGRVVVTGQNPGSGLGLGKAIYEALFGKAYE